MAAGRSGRDYSERLIRAGYALIAIGVALLIALYTPWKSLPPEAMPLVVVGLGLATIACGAAMVRAGRRARALLKATSILAVVLAGIVMLQALFMFTVAGWRSIAGGLYLVMPESAEETYTRSGSLSGFSTVNLRVDCMNVKLSITGWSNDSYKLVVTVKVRSWSESRARELLEKCRPEIVTAPNGTAYWITIKAPREVSGLLWDMSISLYVPWSKPVSAVLRGINGAVKVYNVTLLDADVSLMNGKVDLYGVRARAVTCTLTNGEVEFYGAASRAALVVTTGRALVRVEPAMNGSYAVSVNTGDITVRLPVDPDVGYSVSAETSVGAVSLSVPNMHIAKEERGSVTAYTVGYSSKPVQISLTLKATIGSVEVKRD